MKWPCECVSLQGPTTGCDCIFFCCSKFLTPRPQIEDIHGIGSGSGYFSGEECFIFFLSFPAFGALGDLRFKLSYWPGKKVNFWLIQAWYLMGHPGLLRENQEEVLEIKGKDHYDLRKQEGRHVLGPERAPELEKGAGRVEAGGGEQKGLPLLLRCLICQSLNCGSEADIECDRGII